MPHHLVSEGELKTFCIYCKTDVPIRRWKSEWHSEMHYKTLKCSSCGRDLHIRVNFDGSGHDSWNCHTFKSKITKKVGGGKENIEDKIRVLEKIKILKRYHPKK